MRIEIKWHRLVPLRDGSHDNLIYRIVDHEAIPLRPGVYVFGRMRSGAFVPIYVGQAGRLRSRIKGQFNNVKLMMGIKKMPGRRRFLAVGEIIGKPGQSPASALNTVERSLIRHALAEGHEILNIMGARERLHHIRSAGSRESRGWVPRDLVVPKRR